MRSLAIDLHDGIDKMSDKPILVRGVIDIVDLDALAQRLELEIVLLRIGRINEFSSCSGIYQSIGSNLNRCLAFQRYGDQKRFIGNLSSDCSVYIYCGGDGRWIIVVPI